MRNITVAAALLFAVAAHAAPAGSMILTAEQVDTGSADFEKEAKKKQIQSLPKSNEQWTLYFLAFLKKAAGSHQVQVVFYDLAEKKHEPTNAFPIQTQPTAKILASSVTFSGDQGFKAGHKYNVLVTRLVGGKEDVYARSTISLK
ncbi:MAG: hypothetical protein JWN44_3173 [Myxococcales bacterium]|nr:hypothetical protein [Myxococcales bacterium]